MNSCFVKAKTLQIEPLESGEFLDENIEDCVRPLGDGMRESEFGDRDFWEHGC